MKDSYGVACNGKLGETAKMAVFSTIDSQVMAALSGLAPGN